MARAQVKPQPRVVNIRFPSAQPSAEPEWLHLRVRARPARVFRKLARLEQRQQTALLDDMLTLYVETKHPELEVDWCEPGEE